MFKIGDIVEWADDNGRTVGTITDIYKEKNSFDSRG